MYTILTKQKKSCIVTSSKQTRRNLHDNETLTTALISTSLLTGTAAKAQETRPVFEEANLRFERYFFEGTDQSAYITEDTKGKNIPEENGLDQIELKKYDEVTLVGTNSYDFWKIKVDGQIYYIDQDDLTTSKKEIEALKKEEAEEEKRSRKKQKLPNGADQY